MRLPVVAITLMSTVLLATPSLAQQQNDLIKYCKADIERLCPGVPPGEGRLMACLKANAKAMSVGCAQALQKMKANAGK